MKKALSIIIILGIMLTSAASCANANPAPSTADNTSQKSAFNFIFKYGVMGRNTLDTFQGTFTKDMVIDPSITIPLILSGEEMDSIYQKMVEIDFFNYPVEFEVTVPPGELIGRRTPYPSYYFLVELNSEIFIVQWEDEIINPDVKADKLRELINLIRNIIESKEEYKALPEPRSGYL